jgi:hypothetical protein
MYTVTLLLDANERQRIEQVAEQLWPMERLSSTEICRRLMLAGIQTLPELSAADQASLLRRAQMTQLVPDRERLKH